MATERKVVLEVDTAQSQQKIDELNQKLQSLYGIQNQLKQTIKDLNTEFKNAAKGSEDEAKANAKLASAQTELNKNSMNLKETKKQLNQANKEYLTATDPEYAANQKKSTMNQVLSNSEKELANTTKIKNAVVIEGVKNIGSSMASLPGELGKIGGAVEGATTIMQGFNAANPVGWITILIQLFKGWLDAMMKNAAFARGFNQVMAGISAVFETLTSWIVKGSKAIGDFVGGIKSFPDFLKKVGDAIKENLTNRLKSVGTLFDGLVSIMKGDFVSGGKKVLDGLVGMGTGITNVTDKIGAAVGEAKKSFDIGEQIKKMEQDLAKFNRNVITQQQALENQLAEAEQKMGRFAGKVLSKEEIDEAFKKYDEAEKGLLAIKQTRLNKELAIQRAKNKKELDEQKENLPENITALKTIEAALLDVKSQARLMNTNAEIRHSRFLLQISNQQVANAKDAMAMTTAAYYEDLNSAGKTTEQKLALIEKIREANKISAEQQMTAIEGLRGAEIDWNKIMSESNATVIEDYLRGLKYGTDEVKIIFDVIKNRRTEDAKLGKEDLKIKKEQADKLIAQAQDQINADKALMDEKIALNQATQDEILKANRKRIDDTYKAELDGIQLLLDAGAITQQKADEDREKAKRKHDVEIAGQTKDETDALKQRTETNLQNELEAASGNWSKTREIQSKQLKIEREDAISNAKQKGEDIDTINRIFDAKEIQAKVISINAEISEYQKMIDVIGGLFEQGSTAAKIASTASVAINTYKAASEQAAQAFTFFSQQMYPQGAFALAMTATTIASGVNNINKIWAVDEKNGAKSVTPAAGAVVPPQITATSRVTNASERANTPSQRVYVLESDITTTQKKVSVIQSKSTF